MKTAAITLVALALTGAPALAADVPSLVGTWKGDADGVSLDRGWLKGGATIVVTEQQGRSFKAQVVYPTDKGDVTEDLYGTITPDGTTVLMAGDDGYHFATVKSPTTIDNCYVEAGDDAMAVCERLEKQP